MGKRILLFLIVFCFAAVPSKAGSIEDIQAVRGLTQRIMGDKSNKIVYEIKYSSNDYFRLSAKDNHILITGNNANSLAAGLNHYLKKWCKTTVSWYLDEKTELPNQLPLPSATEEFKAKVPNRFFLNYCTYGYTMPFWKWEQWERLIDWMALNGINMPLAITGQEAVWQVVWRSFGMTDKEIRSYFTGPSYLPWHRMANIDKWMGPLPQQYIDAQVELQKKILKRERSFNMLPVLPAFSGHVPGRIKELYPQAEIQHLGKWAGFPDRYRCYFLHPEDQLFGEIQKRFLREQKRLFGTNHVYGLDPFNEVDPPSWEPCYLGNVANGIYKTLSAVDPDAIWLQMAWLFYHDREKWTAPRIESFVKGVPQGKMVMLDYHCENVELWRRTNSFYGQPFIWCYLGNFGGNTNLGGNAKESGRRLDNALAESGAGLRGIGSTLEGLDVQQFPYEYIFDKAWGMADDEGEWINRLADRHAGEVDCHARKAWKILFDSVFVQIPKTLGTMVCYRPVMNDPNKRLRIEYTPSALSHAWAELIQSKNYRSPALQIDIITTGRQLLGLVFVKIKNRFDEAYRQRDIEALSFYGKQMSDVIKDIEQLNAYHARCGLDTWLKEASSYSEDKEETGVYVRNAKALITIWGGSLNDYAARSWAGLTESYYAKRWQMYIDAVKNAVQSGKDFSQADLNSRVSRFEQQWVSSPSTVKVSKPSMDLHQFSLNILGKLKKNDLLLEKEDKNFVYSYSPE